MEQGDGPVVLCVHGNPTWGFLYRKVASALRGESVRVILPDLVGLGFSDKPLADAHRLDAHVAWMASLVRLLDLRDVVLVVQDWGGPIGCGAFLEQPERLRGLVILNTVLGPPKPGFKSTYFHRLARVPGISELLFRGLSFPQRGMFLAQGNPLGMRSSESRAYRFPLRDRRRNQAPLALARMVPDTLSHPSCDVLEAVQGFISTFTGPVEMVWGDRDPVLGRLKNRIHRWVPHANVTSTDAGHFLQEEVPQEIADAVMRVVRSA